MRTLPLVVGTQTDGESHRLVRIDGFPPGPERRVFAGFDLKALIAASANGTG